MAYNNYYPVSYQNPYYPQQQPMYQQPQQQYAQPHNTNIIWVSGEVGAKSYPVAPNTTVQLWDSEDKVIYIKSADASGMPSMKTLDYTIRNENPPVQAKIIESEYITREEFESLKTQISALSKEIETMKPNNME